MQWATFIAEKFDLKEKIAKKRKLMESSIG